MRTDRTLAKKISLHDVHRMYYRNLMLELLFCSFAAFVNQCYSQQQHCLLFERDKGVKRRERELRVREGETMLAIINTLLLFTCAIRICPRSCIHRRSWVRRNVYACNMVIFTMEDVWKSVSSVTPAPINGPINSL